MHPITPVLCILCVNVNSDSMSCFLQFGYLRACVTQESWSFRSSLRWPYLLDNYSIRVLFVDLFAGRLRLTGFVRWPVRWPATPSYIPWVRWSTTPSYISGSSVDPFVIHSSIRSLASHALIHSRDSFVGLFLVNYALIYSQWSSVDPSVARCALIHSRVQSFISHVPALQGGLVDLFVTESILTFCSRASQFTWLYAIPHIFSPLPYLYARVYAHIHFFLLCSRSPLIHCIICLVSRLGILCAHIHYISQSFVDCCIDMQYLYIWFP